MTAEELQLGTLAIGGYLIGSFPTGVVFTRKKYGIDVREMGSGNIGATNVTRNFGWYAGALVFAIDFLKGLVPVFYVRRYFANPWAPAVVGLALVIGHCFSAFLRLRGGKGVATSLGVLLAVAPWAAVLAAVVYVVLLATVKISAVGSLGGMAALLAYLAIVPPPFPTLVLALGISVIVLVRHRTNIQRLLNDFQNRKRAPTGRKKTAKGG